MSLSEELERIAVTASGHAAPGERIEAVLATEPQPGERVYICSFANGEDRSWLAFDEGGDPVESRALIREAVSIAAMCELAEETAGVDVSHPRLATPAYLDAVGAEGQALAAGFGAVDALATEVEQRYKRELA